MHPTQYEEDYANRFPFIDNEADMVARCVISDTFGNNTAEQTEVLKSAKSSTLRSWAVQALNGGDFKLTAEASLELLSRDINDYEAHQALL